MKTHRNLLWSCAAVVAATLPATAWPAHEIDAGEKAERHAIVAAAARLIEANYVHPERTGAVSQVLEANLESGKYDEAPNGDAFLEAINRDMQAAAHDQHLQVVRNPRIVAQIEQEATGSKSPDPGYVKMLRASNFRLRKVESLDGNIGYFKFDGFVEPEYATDAFVGAMDFLHDSSALIIDLSDNGGGSSQMSEMLLSYFLRDGTHIGDSWDRTTGRTTTLRSEHSRRVRQMLDVPITVLVGERTASAAEAVAYTLQKAKRAVVVGTRTRGMANAGRFFAIDANHAVMVPTVRHRNAVTGSNWEGTGVIPDIESAPEHALAAAMAETLQTLAQRQHDAKERFALRFLAHFHRAAVAARAPPAGFLDACVGAYEGGRRIVKREGSLYFRMGAIDRRMSYLDDETFAVDGRRDYKMRFPYDGGAVARVEVLWFDDTSDNYARITPDPAAGTPP